MSARNTFAATRRSHAILKRLQRGEGVKIREVSEKFGIQYPQARADLKLLEELYDLTTHRDGRVKVWKMPGADDIERQIGIAAAVELGGIALDVFKHTPYGERIDELVSQLRQSVGTAHKERLDRLSNALVLRRTWLPVNEEQMLETLEEFLDAIGLRNGVEMTYERSDGEVGEYLVIPRRLIWYESRLWLQAVDTGKQKLFDVAGVQAVERVEQRSLVDRLTERRLEKSSLDEPRDSDGSDGDDGDAVDEQDLESSRRQAIQEVVRGDIEDWFEYGTRQQEDEYFSNSFGIFATNYDSQEVELIVRGSWEQYLRRYRVHPSQTNEETDDGLRVRFDIGLCPEFRSFVLGMIPDVEIVSPAEFRSDIEARMQDWKT